MNTLTIEHECNAQDVTFSEDSFNVLLDDGRSVTIPLAWFPRLCHATRQELENYELIGDGEGIHWPDLDEDISIEEADLYVKEIFVDSARMLKRLRPAPQGRAHRIRKRSNHVTIVIDNHNQEETKESNK